MPLKGTPTWRLHTKPYKFGKNVFPNISHMKYLTDLILGEAFCIFIFFHFPDSGLSVLSGLYFYSFFDGVILKKTCLTAKLRSKSRSQIQIYPFLYKTIHCNISHKTG